MPVATLYDIHGGGPYLVHISNLPETEPDLPTLIAGLTPRMREIWEFIAEGAQNKEIAHRLCISDQTVKNHITMLLARLKVYNRQELTKLWYEQRIDKLESRYSKALARLSQYEALSPEELKYVSNIEPGNIESIVKAS